MDHPENQNQYLSLLEGLNHGDLAVTLEEDLQEVVQAVQNTGLKGALSLNLVIERKKHGQIKIVPKITKKTPREELDAALRYVSSLGQLLEQDPDQPEFEFKTVPIRDAETAGGQ